MCLSDTATTPLARQPFTTRTGTFAPTRCMITVSYSPAASTRPRIDLSPTQCSISMNTAHARIIRKLGRFMSEDPKLFDAGDYNLFRYCHNDPIDLSDPMGLDTMQNAMAVAEAVVPGQ